MIFIDYGDKRPIYEQIVDRFEKLILSGGLEADEKLPSVRSLAMDLSINPNTIQKAYAELERQGYIYSIKGRGNFVRRDRSFADEQKKKLLTDLSDMVRDLRDTGITKEEITALLETIYEEE